MQSAAELVKDAAQLWRSGNASDAGKLLAEARQTLSRLRVYQLLGVQLTHEIYGVRIEINKGRVRELPPTSTPASA